MMTTSRFAAVRGTLLGMSALALAACGGDSGPSNSGNTGSAPAPAPAPSPTPTATPTPTGFNDTEFQNSPWLVVDNALPAFEDGASGRGVRVALVDSGLILDNPEFAGRIQNGDVGAHRDDLHGMLVGQIAFGARNGTATMGVAFEADILAYNTLNCISDCFHSQTDLGTAISNAEFNGAVVVNLSVVGDFARDPLFFHIRRATERGVIVVIAAGNTGGAQPNGFATQIVQEVPSPLIILVGAHDTAQQIVASSSRAGDQAIRYVTAYGGATSFSTPVVTGTVALLRAAFPSLTPAQVVQAIYDSANDTGAPGIDPINGHGALNIGAAYLLAKQRAGV